MLTVAGLVGQIFTLARELFVADKVGVSPDLDALLVAAVAPVMFASLISAGTSVAIVPGYIAAQRDHGREAADRLLGATLSWTVVIGIILVLVVSKGAELAVTITGPGLDEHARSVAIGYVPLVAPMLVFSAMGGILGATFQIHGRMRSLGLAWLIGPVASLILTVLLWGSLHLTALAIAMTAQQAVIVVAMVLMAIYFRIMPTITLRADRSQSGRFIRHALPLTISASVLQFNLLTDRAVATLITPGAVSALRYAEGVIRIPLNAIWPAWTAAIYPALVRASLLGGSRSFVGTASGALRYVIAIFVPIAIATAALAPLIVEVAYVRGAFDERAAELTRAALVGFAPLLLFAMASAVLTGAHNARERSLFLMATGFLDAILNAVFNVGLGLVIGVAGIALSTSLTLGIIQVIKAWRFGSLEEDFPLASLILVSGRALIAGLVVAVPIALIAWELPHGLGFGRALALLIGLATAGMVGYVVMARLVGLEEPWSVAKTLVGSPRRFLRGRK